MFLEKASGVTICTVHLVRNASVNVKLEGRTTGICGAFDLYCPPYPQEFDQESGSQGGDVCFFGAEEWN